VAVGAHVSAEPVDTLTKGNGILDVVARGEYDYTLCDLATGRPLTEVEGISYWNDGDLAHNPSRPLIENLDDLPFPAWHHIDPYDYPDAGKLYPFITLMGGRGCEGRCTFCVLPQVMYGQHYRPRSPELVVDEIEHDLKLFPFLQEIMFEDDTLTLKRYLPRLQAICEEILRRGLKITWSANARADLRDLETLKLMKRSGCRMLCVGFEFGSQQILNNVRKGIKLEHMREFAELTSKTGIRVHGCFMIGGPGETQETARQTIEFAKSLPVDTVQFSGVCAYPGTEYYEWVRDNGHLVPQDWPEWVDENLEQRAIVDFPQLSVDEINELVDRGLREFYLRPGQVTRMLRSISSWSDVKAKWHGLRSFLDYFGSDRKGIL
jgi:anaerobic magnesium-protoporphyrin IX monomethyl ester cyclase